MTQTLQQYWNKHFNIYADLATNTSSVAELIFKLAIYGDQWTQWDWALFFWHLSQVEKNLNVENNFAQLLLDDISQEIDNSRCLDNVITNKTILTTLIQLLDNKKTDNNRIMSVLAHIFRKFPTLWNMSWMYVKHGSKAIRKHQRTRTHVMYFAVKDENVQTFIQTFLA